MRTHISVYGKEKTAWPHFYNVLRPMFFSMVYFILSLLTEGSVGMAQQPTGFAFHGEVRGIGSCLAAIIGPGPESGTERLYASHCYSGGVFDLIATDPISGQTFVFASPLASESGARAVLLAPNSLIYIGTQPTAHIMRLDWPTKTLIDMGRPSKTEQYIWQLVVGNDNKLYGCTYPGAKLIRFDPVTNRGEDLGSMSQTERYARYLAANDKGFVYVGVGMSRRDLVAYEIATGRHESILPEDLAGEGCTTVFRSSDGIVYAEVNGTWLKLDGFTAIRTPLTTRPVVPTMSLKDGRGVTYDGRSITIRNPDGTAEHRTTDYRGKCMQISRIGLGPDGMIYGSTELPIHLFRLDVQSDRLEKISEVGDGEIYSFLPWRNKLIAASYSKDCPIMIYDPAKLWTPSSSPEGNPWTIHFEGENSSWRPVAMILGPEEQIYIGAYSGYGLLGGHLCTLDPITGRVENYRHMVRDHSVTALMMTDGGLILGGTSVFGGAGSHATEKDARIFLWNPLNRNKVFEAVPVPGSSVIDAFGMSSKRLAYGFTDKDTMFIFDCQSREILARVPNTLGRVLYNAVGRGEDGKLYGLYSGGIFTIDEENQQLKLMASYPKGVTSGFAILGKKIFFTSNSQILSYTIP